MNSTKRRQMDFGGAKKAEAAGARFSRRLPCVCGHDEKAHDDYGCVFQTCACSAFVLQKKVDNRSRG